MPLPLTVSTGRALLAAPSLPPGMTLWLDAAAIGGLSSGDAVSAWADRSGIGGATGSGGTRPTYQAAVLNGLPVVRLAGSQYLDLANTGLARNVPGLSIVTVTNPPVLASGQQRILFLSSGTNAAASRVAFTRIAPQTFGLGGRRTDADSFDDGALVVNIGQAYNIWTGIYDYAARTATLFQNNAQVAQDTTFASAGAATSDTASLSARIGANNTGGDSLVADIAELIVWPRALTVAERTAVARYLGAKWGLTTS